MARSGSALPSRPSRPFLALLVLLMAACVALCTAQAREPQRHCSGPLLPATAVPGALLLGCLPPGDAGTADAVVEFEGRTVRVAEDGRFVIGIGRDASGTATVRVRAGNGAAAAANVREVEIALAPRDYRIERVDGLPQQTVTPDPEIAARIAAEQGQVAAARRRDEPREDFSGGFTRPLQGRISGVYGSQRVLNGVPRSPHMGMDIAAPTGTPVRAPAPGVVSFAATDLYLTGGTVLLDHGHGLSSSFLHLSQVEVQPGQRVARGERIGAVGATGRASGPHLHWGLNWFDVRLDPALLPDPAQASAPAAGPAGAASQAPRSP